jgi:GLPGLI family protein
MASVIAIVAKLFINNLFPRLLSFAKATNLYCFFVYSARTTNMKTLIMTGTVLLLAVNVQAQKKLSEATISYDIVINTGTERPRAADYLDGATSTVYLKGGKSRTEMVSALGTEATIIDDAAKAVYSIKEYGAQKYIVRMTPANWKEINRRYEDVKFGYTNETKTILGYKCLKAVATPSNGPSFVVWYTPDLVPENNNFQYMNRTLPGLAMEYESNVGSMKVTYTVSKINLNPVPAAKFDLPKAGFRLLSYEESKGQ